MKSILLSIFLFTSLIVNAQFSHDTTSNHLIDIKHMQYHPCYHTGVSTFMPVKWIKITTKIGVNTSTAKQDFNILVINGQEAEPVELFNLFGYDTRVKIYMTKRFRILLRSQYFGASPGFPNYHYYSAGLLFKF